MNHVFCISYFTKQFLHSLVEASWAAVADECVRGWFREPTYLQHLVSDSALETVPNTVIFIGVTGECMEYLEEFAIRLRE